MQNINQTIIFIHGNSLSAATFNNQKDLAQQFNCIAIDLPGHGENHSLYYNEKDFCIESYVNYVVDYIGENVAGDFILVGHSLGGHIAIEAAPQLKNLKGLFVFGTPPVAKPPQLDNAFLPNPNISFLFTEELNEEQKRTISYDIASKNNNAELIYLELNKANPKVRSGLAACIGEGRHQDELQILRTNNLPVAIIHGKYDAMINSNYFGDLSIPTLWQNKIHMIEDASHSPHLENSTEFNNLLSQFCETVFV